MLVFSLNYTYNMSLNFLQIIIYQRDDRLQIYGVKKKLPFDKYKNAYWISIGEHFIKRQFIL